jgi:hypothetical protein
MTGEQGRDADVEGEYPAAGETAAEMVGTLNMVLRNLRDQGQEGLEADETSCRYTGKTSWRIGPM